MGALRSRRIYDYRIQEAICESGDRDLFPELNIPRSTIRSWIHRGTTDFVSCDLAEDDRGELVAEIEKLRCHTARFGAMVALLVSVFRGSIIQLDYERLPEGDAKRILLRAIKRAREVLPLNTAHRITRLSPSRYHGWCRAEAGCDLDEQPSCPRVFPTRLTPNEVENMRRMVENDDHRHMSLRARALHAQRIGKVLASPSMWHRMVRSAGWRRPRKNVYPAKPKVGIRAEAPGELFHLDVTIIRLLDGSRAYLHAVIDNYSRRISSWTLEERLGSGVTCRILLAQVEVTFSNSMIEAFWRSLKYSWLYLHSLDSFSALRRLIEFYVIAHSEVMPHSAFDGQTPNEMLFGSGDGVAKRLPESRESAREKRMEANRAAGCGVCVGETTSEALLLQRPRSRMS